jgi:hypothetical protein
MNPNIWEVHSEGSNPQVDCGIALLQKSIYRAAGTPTLTLISGERGWTRTIDPCLKRALLCQLSYAPSPLVSTSYKLLPK